MRTRRRAVVTIHGINTDGDWQKIAESVLKPHFDHVPFKYQEYRTIARSMKLFLGPVTAVLALLVFLSFLAIDVGFWLVAFCALAGFLLSLSEARFRRKRIVHRFKEKVEREASRGRENPHVIAHSLGTYIVGKAIKTFPTVLFDRVVLVGCVLDSRFDWLKIHQKHGSFNSIRNELSGKDWVVRLACLAGWLFWDRDVGPGGVGGFAVAGSQALIVHNVATPFGPCDDCRAAPLVSIPSIHNVQLQEFGHSDAFLGSAHARMLWLPFLWGIEPSEYRSFVAVSVKAAAMMEDSYLSDSLRILEAEFLEKELPWVGLSLGEYALKRFSDLDIDQPKAAELVQRTPRAVWHTTNRAEQEAEKLQNGARANMRLIETLHPMKAVDQAIQSIINKYVQRKRKEEV